MRFIKYSLVAVALMGATAQAADITITLSDAEQRALLLLLDQANKANGLANAEPALYFAKKLQQAAQEAEKKDTPK